MSEWGVNGEWAIVKRETSNVKRDVMMSDFLIADINKSEIITSAINHCNLFTIDHSPFTLHV